MSLSKIEWTQRKLSGKIYDEMPVETLSGIN